MLTRKIATEVVSQHYTHCSSKKSVPSALAWLKATRGAAGVRLTTSARWDLGKLVHWRACIFCCCLFGLDAEFFLANEAGEILITVFASHHFLRLIEALSPNESIRNIKLCFRDTLGDIDSMMTGMKCVQVGSM